MKRLLKHNCNLTLALNYYDFGVYELIVNHQDFFDEAIIKLTTKTSDLDLINRIKYNEDVEDRIKATKEAMLLVFSDHRKCCMEIKHKIDKYNNCVTYYYEEQIQKTIWNTWKEFCLNN